MFVILWDASWGQNWVIQNSNCDFTMIITSIIDEKLLTIIAITYKLDICGCSWGVIQNWATCVGSNFVKITNIYYITEKREKKKEKCNKRNEREKNGTKLKKVNFV